MFKISKQIINFLIRAMGKSRGTLTVGGLALAEVKIQRSVSLWRLIIANIICNCSEVTLSFIKKCIGGYQFTKSHEKNNHFLYVDNIKTFTRNGEELEPLTENVRNFNLDVGIEFGIEKWVSFSFLCISTFVTYLMPKPSLWKISSCTNWPILKKINELILFPRVLVPKWT